MNPSQAKFILSACRPDGSDAKSADFEEAIRLADQNPDLAAWFERSKAFDSAVARKVSAIRPPSGLKETILAGSKVTVAHHAPFKGWAWLGGIAAAAVLAVVISMGSAARPSGGAGAFADFALYDLSHGQHGSHGEAAARLVQTLQTSAAPLPSADTIDFAALRSSGCRTLSFAGRDVMEVCFARGGVEFHLYVTPRDSSFSSVLGNAPMFVSQATGAAAVWADRAYGYALVSKSGVEALRKLF